jgi:HAD superfamily hydrolase (TIGR01459 family)
MKRAPGNLPLPVFILGPERDRAVHEGLNVVPAEAEKAEIVLCTGLFDDEMEGPEDYRALLETFLSRRLPFLCANPDLVVRRGDKLVYCAGAIARLYEELGGEVVYFGKPYAPVFELAISRARSLGATGRPLMIGDGLETDIKGAEAMGWDALFVLGGIHGVEIGTLPPGQAEARLKELFAENHTSARWRISELRW